MRPYPSINHTRRPPFPSLSPTFDRHMAHALGLPARMRASPSRLWGQVLVRWSLAWSAEILPA